MAVAFVQSAVNGTTPFAGDGIADINLPGVATIGNAIVVGFSVEASSRSVTSVVHDPSGAATVLNLIRTIEISTVRELWIYGGLAASASAAIRATLSSAIAGTDKIVAAEFSGVHQTTPFPSSNAATNNALGDHDTGNVIVNDAGSALFGMIQGSNGTYTNDADFTELTGANNGNGTAGYDLVDAGTYSYTPTTAGTEETLQAIVVIAPAAAGGDSGRGGIRHLSAGLPHRRVYI